MTYYELNDNVSELDKQLIEQMETSGALSPITLEDLLLGPIADRVSGDISVEDLGISYDEGYSEGLADGDWVGNDINTALAPLFKRAPEGNYLGVGRGWWKLLLHLDSRLAITDPDYTIGQIKEKFGTLRFYTGPLSEGGQALVQAAEEATNTICEDCGKPGTLDTNDFWVRTLCPRDTQRRLDKSNAADGRSFRSA